MPYDMPVFDIDEERDIRDYGMLILDPISHPPPWKPLFIQLWNGYGAYGKQYGAAKICAPGSKGWVELHKSGSCYLTALRTTKEERKAREPIFRERMAPVLRDPWYWLKAKEELKVTLERIAAFDVHKADDMELAAHFLDAVLSSKQMQEFHFDAMYALGEAYILFRKVCPESTGIKVTDPEFSRLMSGFDNDQFRAAKGLAALATRALETKLSNDFKLPDEEVIPALEQSDVGRKWLEGFWDYLKVQGLQRQQWREMSSPTWQEEPSLAIAEIKRAMAIGGVHAPELQREHLVKEREEAEREVIAKVAYEERDWFRKLMACTQASHVFSEDHGYWCEGVQVSLVRRAAVEIGKRFANAGALDHYEDVLYLLCNEIVHAAASKEKSNVHRIAQGRKKEYEANVAKFWELPRFLGDPRLMPELVENDAIFGVAIAPQVARPEEVGATLVGAAGAPGVAEGIARVIMTDVQMGEIQPGEILVAPVTNPTWTPLFGMLKAVVTDGGGYLAHAVIIARDHGIPAVVGTMEATRKIKTGDRIRVNGNLLRVHVLGR
jgi:phosphohistidine swiveling domain-containing protein